MNKYEQQYWAFLGFYFDHSTSNLSRENEPIVSWNVAVLIPEPN